MKLTLYWTLLLGSLMCFTAPKSVASQLPDCKHTVCSDIIHDKVLGKATAVVWGQQGVIASQSFDLDSTAVLSHTQHSNGMGLPAFDDTPPPAPCTTGACSLPYTTSYDTATMITTVTITYSYLDNALIDVSASQTSVPKPTARVHPQ